LTDRAIRHNLEITETAFGITEGRPPPASSWGAAQAASRRMRN